MQRILFFLLISFFVYSCKPPEERAEHRQIVVLTFDDAVKSHYTFVAPLLKELGFGATFFISHRWMQDTANFMNWQEIGELHNMGFEIGNHSWSHLDYSLPENVARLEGELGLIDLHLGWLGVPKPTSFAYCGNWFGPETVEKLQKLGYKHARRGMQPEVAYGELAAGPLYDPSVHHPLLVPSAGDAYPNWDLEHFKKVVSRTGDGKIAVLQFHGVPDMAHEWVTTDPELFRQYMHYLKKEGFEVMAMRDLDAFLPENLPLDPMLGHTHSSGDKETNKLPAEMASTRENLEFWTQIMQEHNYSQEEMQLVVGLSSSGASSSASSRRRPKAMAGTANSILPYPGGRHPRIGFLDGAMDPLRGTKFSVFLPHDPSQYVVIDLPEAIFSNLGLTFLAHRHIPTIWDSQHIFIDNVDWQVNDDGSLENTWTLPNGISLGVEVVAESDGVDMKLWLYNGTDHRLDSLKTQVCVMLKGAHDYNDQSNDNKRFSTTTAAVRSGESNHWILTSWERTFNPWGNPDVPCIHTDPMFESCEPGDTVRLQGRLWFHEGEDTEGEL